MDTLFEQIAMSAVAEAARAPLLPTTQRGAPPGRAPVAPPPAGPPPPGWAPPGASASGGSGGSGAALPAGALGDARDDDEDALPEPPGGDADDTDEGFVLFSSRLVRPLAAQRHRRAALSRHNANTARCARGSSPT
jgi:hypothetical protein